MAREDIIVVKESTPGTWVTPTTGIPTTKTTYKLGRSYINKRYTGKGRHLAKNLVGGIAPSGTFELDVFPDYMGLFISALGFTPTTVTPAGGTNAREHGFLAATDAAQRAMSVQIKLGASNALNVLRCSMNKMTLTLAGGAEAKMAFDWLAKDIAIAGDDWNYDGETASEAIISSPTYIGASLTPFMFYEAALVLGGTPSLDGTSKQFSISGGSAIAYVENLELTIENGLEQFHTLQNDPTPYGYPPQDLVVGVKMDMDFSTIRETYFDYFRDGTQAALKITLAQGADSIETDQAYMFEVVVPNLSFSMGEMPDIEGSSTRRQQTVEAEGVLDATSDHVIGITIRDTQTGY